MGWNRYTKDGAVAWHSNGADGHDGGIYHFMHMQEPPKVDENLKDGISTTPVSKRRFLNHAGRATKKKLGK